MSYEGVESVDIDFVDNDYAEEVNAELRQLLGNKIADGLDYGHVNGIHVAVANPREDRGPSLDDVLSSDSEDMPAPLVRGLPFANGFNIRRANQPVQMQAIADLTRRPVIGVASPSVGSSYKDLGIRDRRQIARGDFTPYSAATLDALDTYTDGKLERADVMGASQFGTVGMNLAALAMKEERLQIKNVLAVSPANGKNRTVPELMNDFGAAGPGELQERLLSTGLPGLVDAVGLSMQQQQKIAPRFVGMTVAESLSHPLQNFALTRGLTRPEHTWKRDLPTLLEKGVHTTIVTEGQGAIAPNQDIVDRVHEVHSMYTDEQWLRLPGAIALLNIRGGDHTQGDHYPTIAAILRGDRPQQA